MPPGRKPLFTKPAWASKPVTSPISSDDLPDSRTLDVAEDSTPIFGQKHLYEDIVAQERLRREKHAKRVKEREEKSKTNRDSVNVGQTKRRRISRNKEDGSDDSREAFAQESETDGDNRRDASSHDGHGSADTDHEDDSDNIKQARSVERQPVSSSRRKKRSSEAKNAPVVSLDVEDGDNDDDDDDDDVVIESVKELTREESSKIVETAAKDVTSEAESDEEDDFLRELKRKAREEAKRKKLGLRTSPSHSPNSEFDTFSPGTNAIDSLSQEDTNRDNRPVSNLTHDDPEIQIYIETMIPQARSLIVNRRASQPLRIVKEFWCQRNDIHPKIASRVFFTWNGTRLYDSTTMRGILEQLKKARPTKNGSDPSNGKIVIEAVTDEIYEYRQQQREKRRKEAELLANGGSQDDHDDENNTTDNTNKTGSFEAENPNETVDQEPNGRIVIRLVCPEINSQSMRIWPHTTVEKLITAFKTISKIDPSKQCWLSHDGTRLEDGQTAEEIGFESDDVVDVYLR